MAAIGVRQEPSKAVKKAREQGRRVAILHPQGGEPLTRWAAQNPGVPLALLIGPEGGFADQEIDQTIAQGATKVTFGPRVLRTETAGLAALAALQAVLGDLR
jgi:16S rRNA (uracil1498-N3)-methyltransferase